MKQKTMALTAAGVLLLCFLSIPVLLLTQRADPVRDYVAAIRGERMLLEDEDGSVWLSYHTEDDLRLVWKSRLERAVERRDENSFLHWLPVEEPVRDEEITMELGSVVLNGRDGLPWLLWRIENHLPVSLRESRTAVLQVLLGENWYYVPTEQVVTLEALKWISPEEDYRGCIPLYIEAGGFGSGTGKPLPFGRYRLVWESEGHGQAVEFLWNQAALDAAVSVEYIWSPYGYWMEMLPKRG